MFVGFGLTSVDVQAQRLHERVDSRARAVFGGIHMSGFDVLQVSFDHQASLFGFAGLWFRSVVVALASGFPGLGCSLGAFLVLLRVPVNLDLPGL